MCRPLRRLTITAAVLTALVVLPFAGAQGESRVIRASATFQRLGDWRIDRAATFQGAIDALGQPVSCRVHEREHVTARWILGVTVDLWTLGGMPPGENGCTAPDLRLVTRRTCASAFATQTSSPCRSYSRKSGAAE